MKSDDKGPIPDTKEMLIKVIFKVVDDLILFKKFKERLDAAKRARGEPVEDEVETEQRPSSVGKERRK